MAVISYKKGPFPGLQGDDQFLKELINERYSSLLISGLYSAIRASAPAAARRALNQSTDD